MTESTSEVPSTASVEGKEPKNHRRQMLKEVLESVTFILLAFLLLRGIVQNVKIDGSSMEPTFHHEQHILVNKLVYLRIDLNAPLRLLPGKSDLPPRLIYPFHMPERGDTIVFHAPTEEHDYIKRVIGLPGDHVVIRNAVVSINGVRLEEPYLVEETICTGPVENCDLVVPDGTVYVLGDNRGASTDSRSFGPLSLDRVVGKAWLSYWPQENWSLISTPSYAIDH